MLARFASTVVSLSLSLLLGCGAEPSLTGAGSETGGDAGASATAPDPGSSTDTPTSTSTSTSVPTTGGASEGQSSGTAGSTDAPATTDALDSTSTGDPSTSTGDPDTSTDTGADTSTGADSVLTLDHMQVKGTHNSYHLKPLVPLDKSHDYSHAPLDQQLEGQGVRAFELDIHKGVGVFEVYHISVIDSNTTCETFSACLGVIKGWSDAHPQHLPISIWIEIKDQTGGFPIADSDLLLLDEVIRGVFPADRLLTPDDIQGDHPSVRDALTTEGWPLIDSVRGQVLFILLNVEDDHASNYTTSYSTLAGRAMFARATPQQFALPWAAIAKLGLGDAANIAAAHAARLLIATNVCSAGDADNACFTALDTAKAAGIHMLKDDFPAKVGNKPYWLDLPDGAPARCNPVTAPPECSAHGLEQL